MFDVVFPFLRTQRFCFSILIFVFCGAVVRLTVCDIDHTISFYFDQKQAADAAAASLSSAAMVVADDAAGGGAGGGRKARFVYLHSLECAGFF